MFDFMERMGSAVCHQMAERSFIFDGMQMPLCARCTGIYTGAFFAFCFFFLKKRMGNGRPFSISEALLTGLAVLPVGIDGVCSYLGFWESSQLMRIFSGSLVGAVVPGFLLMAVNMDTKKRDDEQSIYERTAELLLLMVLSVGFSFGLYAGMPIGGLAAVISVAGEVLLWGGAVWLLLKSICKDKAFPYWSVSLLVSAVVLFLMGGLVP
ncbi:MAG: DUF2085 domain-containing protein [Anaerotignum sp.]|nr:DUF2085 domain-containing protein [Anaerotignum sp.]